MAIYSHSVLSFFRLFNVGTLDKFGIMLKFKFGAAKVKAAKPRMEVAE